MVASVEHIGCDFSKYAVTHIWFPLHSMCVNTTFNKGRVRPMQKALNTKKTNPPSCTLGYLQARTYVVSASAALQGVY